VYELLQVSDVVITKCGASMFMETLFSRRIPIVNNYLWEQEKGNVEFLRRNHFGIYERDTRKLSSWINRLFSDARLYSSFNDNIERARLVNGAGMVSDYIVRFNAA
jgi:processive 1,2-diacylglycerol beta-glucosyltransferase/1,2-diacylglycerol 3-beta-galactosyltransferase